MSFTTKIAAGVLLAAATSTALTGCGKKSTSTPATSMKPSATATMKNHHSASPMATSTAKAGYVTATINGQTKQIRAGQDCQKKYASEYTQYGFTCAPKSSGSSTYVLTAK